jgi:uncharacterized protein
MNKARLIIIVLVVAIVGFTIYSMNSNESPQDYIKSIEQERSEKDKFMLEDAESPFSTEHEKFKGLKYYPVDPSFKIVARLLPIERKKIITLSTTDGKQKKYLEYAYAEFELQGKSNKLLILEIMDMGPYRGTLFLAFGDETSAKETYGAGRYLDIKKIKGSTTMTLDFNKSYNPYCAYNESFSCPLPPKENLLNIPIKAGEKVYAE